MRVHVGAVPAAVGAGAGFVVVGFDGGGGGHLVRVCVQKRREGGVYTSGCGLALSADYLQRRVCI